MVGENIPFSFCSVDFFDLVGLYLRASLCVYMCACVRVCDVYTRVHTLDIPHVTYVCVCFHVLTYMRVR